MTIGDSKLTFKESCLSVSYTLFTKRLTIRLSNSPDLKGELHFRPIGNFNIRSYSGGRRQVSGRLGSRLHMLRRQSDLGVGLVVIFGPVEASAIMGLAGGFSTAQLCIPATRQADWLEIWPIVLAVLFAAPFGVFTL